MGITTAALVADYKRSLLDSATVFGAADDADFLRHLRLAAAAIATEKRPRTLQGTLALVAGVATYTAPADLLLPKVSNWGAAPSGALWDLPNTPLPALRLVDLSGERVLVLNPAPTAAQIRAFGSEYPYFYLAAHLIPDAGESSIGERERGLLLLRAQVEALRELTIRNHQKPVTLRAAQGDGSTPRNMTAAALYSALLREYQDAV